jgi:hypothetical protein
MGKELTVVVIVVNLLEHPFASIPVKVYDADADGVNGTLLNTPLDQEYVLAPKPFKVKN